jgi:NADH-quinone oxidoreductase subunit H
MVTIFGLTISEIMNIMVKEGVSIPLIQPLIDFLLKIPIIQYVVALILWKPVFAVLILPGLGGLMISLLFIIWFERKLTARIQWRMGPLEVSRPIAGLMQPMADGMRYLFQEVIVHRGAHKPYFVQLPILAFIPILLPIVFIPAGSIYGINSPYSLIITVALLALIPVTIIAIGWASNSKFAYIGSVREAFMYFAYEIPFMIMVLGMIIIYGTADMATIVEKQGIWGAFLNPFAFLGILITTAMATSRLPFEIAEADQEIAFGPFVEYSGILFGLVMTLAYEKMYIMGLIVSVLFLGGGGGPAIPLLGDLSPAIWLFIKALAVMMVMAFLRSIYPRYRLDQALRIGWNSLISLSLLSLVVAVIVRFMGGV